MASSKKHPKRVRSCRESPSNVGVDGETVSVFDGKQLVSTPGVRVAVVAVGPSCEPPDLSMVIEKVPIVLWGDAGDVDRALMHANTDCAVGSRLLRLYLYVRPRVAALGPGLLFREMSIAILGDTGLHQVHPIPLTPASVDTHACVHAWFISQLELCSVLTSADESYLTHTQRLGTQWICA